LVTMFCSTNPAVGAWYPIGTTDFNGATPAFPDTLFVGPTYGCENGNISGQYDGYTGPDLTGHFAARFRDYSTPSQKPRGGATSTIGFNFGNGYATTQPGSVGNTAGVGTPLSSNDIAGVDKVAQGNWNNIFGDATNVSGTLVEENETSGKATVLTNLMMGTWGSPNLWTTQGPGSDAPGVGAGNGSLMTGYDAVLMTGYLDSTASGTTDVGITNLPSGMVSAGYDVVVYAMGGVSGRGGGYAVLDTNGNVIQGYYPIQAPAQPTNFIQALPYAGIAVTDTPTNWAVGNFVVFTNITASSIVVEANTTGTLGLGATIRAPINAIQLVSPPGLINKGPSGNQPTISVSAEGVITYTGVLRTSTSLLGPWTVVSGATSPYTIPTGGARFFVAASQ